MKKPMKKTLVMLLITMFIASSTLVLQAYAADVPTEAFLDATPNPVSLNQLLIISMWITPSPPGEEVYEDLWLTITPPTGPGSVVSGISTDTDGYTWTEYVPNEIGTWTFVLNFPEQIINGNTYLSCSSSPLYVTVGFEEYTLSITVNPPDGGTVSKYPDQATYHLGDSVELTAHAIEGYTFVGWSGDLTGTANPASVIIDLDPEVTAYFAEEYINPGPDQTIYPHPNVVLHFEYVATGGTVTVTPSYVPPDPPLDGITPYYYIDATLTFTGIVTIGITYDDTGLTPEEEAALDLARFDPAVLIKGDVDSNGKVNLKDLFIIFFALGTRPGRWRWNPACDLNGDLRVNFIDLLIAIRNYGKTSTPAGWTNITTHVDIVSNIVYGDTDHFSPYRVH